MHYEWKTCDLAGPMMPDHEVGLIASRTTDRAAVPDDVFSFPNLDGWRDRVWELLSDVVTEDVKAAFVEQPPEYVVSDDLTWLDEIIEDVTDTPSEIKEMLADKLSSSYRAFRAAHATRTNDPAKFYKEGLRFLRPDEIENLARSIFLNGSTPGITEEHLAGAIDELEARDQKGGRAGQIYFCANERSLVTPDGGSGHYLVYGSEYLYCLAIRVTDTWSAKEALKGIGRPTMFVCDIPVEFLRRRTLLEFSGMILELLFKELLGEDTSDLIGPSAGSALRLDRDIPGDAIVGHYYPARVFDPLWRT